MRQIASARQLHTRTTPVKNRSGTPFSVTKTTAIPSRDEARHRSGAADAATFERIDVDPLRRRLLAALLTGAVAGTSGIVSRARASAQPMPLIEVWTRPSCPCCEGWIAHIEANGFEVRVHDGGNNEARARLDVPDEYGSCHTGVVEGYAIEGHVPAREIHRLLEERPEAIGLALPTMPIGSPGMDGPGYRGLAEPYDVLLIERDGSTSVYASYE